MSEDGGGGGAPVPPPPAETPVLTQVLQGLATVMQEMCNTQKQTSAALMDALQGRHVTGSSSSSGASAVSPALKKLQEKSPEFPFYDGNGENFMWWLASVEEKRRIRAIPDEVAVTFAIEALGSHSRGVILPDQKFANWKEFVAYLKTRYCADSYEYSLLWRLQSLRVERGNFPQYHAMFTTGVDLLEGCQIC